MDEIKYYSDTKSFGIKFGNALNIAATTVGLAAGAHGLVNAMRGDKFVVVYKTASGPGRQNVRAESKIDAISKAKEKVKDMSNPRAFQLPEENDSSVEYYNSLN